MGKFETMMKNMGGNLNRFEVKPNFIYINITAIFMDFVFNIRSYVFVQYDIIRNNEGWLSSFSEHKAAMRTCVGGSAIWDMDKLLHPTDTVGCNHLCITQIPASGTQVRI